MRSINDSPLHKDFSWSFIITTRKPPPHSATTNAAKAKLTLGGFSKDGIALSSFVRLGVSGTPNSDSADGSPGNGGAGENINLTIIIEAYTHTAKEYPRNKKKNF
mmetsp:Transcript_20723/g.30535  ORF Transcript_20723/g.30535 Transcript_20723/m.30535 type:complete len:105 (+) Transcript_20723:284-598(+)